MTKLPPANPGWDYVLDTVLPRLGMWTGGATYERAVCFVEGFDVARGGLVNGALNDWAQARFGRTNIAWPWVLLRLTLGISPEVLEGHDLSGLTEAEDKAAIALLTQALRDVTASR